MSVQTQIDRISEAVQFAIAALTEKGVTVPDGTKVDGLAALIANIEAGATLTVTAPALCTVTVSKDGKSKTKVADTNGVAVFKGLSTGEWTVTITNGEQTSSKTVTITTEYAVLISFSTIPDFTYTGDFEVVNDSDEPITTSQGNWKIRFLTSGTLTFTDLRSAVNGIDVFCVGGGGNGASVGGGGGGGYTSTQKGVILYAGTEISIEIGGSGGNTSAFGITANAGANANGFNGGAGGSGGGSLVKDGGSDGGDGGTHASYNGGTGQGTTTREFGEENGRLYAGGGGGSKASTFNPGIGGDGGGGDGSATIGSDGEQNTGGGGGGGLNGAGSGGSGIVIIRNVREVS